MPLPSSADANSPYLVLTAILNSSARPAALTRSHGDAMDQALNAVGSLPLAGIELVEMPIAPQTFDALRKYSGKPAHTVAVYDIFALPSVLSPTVRQVAGQFLAAEALWTLEASGMLAGVPVNVRIQTPKNWDRDPQKIREKLLAEGALELSDQCITTFKQIKDAWDASQTVPTANSVPAGDAVASAGT